VAAISVGSLVQIPLKSYIGTSKKVEIAEDKLSNRFNRLYSLLAREFSTVPPCEQLDKGSNTFYHLKQEKIYFIC